jgi:transposase
MSSQPDSTTANEIIVGIDWADQQHALEIQYPDRRPTSRLLEQTPQAIDAWITELAELYPSASVVVALERSDGALVAALLKYPQVTIYPVNPTQLHNYRKSQKHSGAKNDPSDARLLCQYLRNYREQLRSLKPDDAATRELALLAEQRRAAVDQRTAFTLELKTVLKQYFPVALELVDSDLYADFFVRLLLKWPTLAKLQKAKPQVVRSFFYAHNLRGNVIERRLAIIASAVPLTADQALLSAGALRVQKCARVLVALNQSIDEYDERLEELLQAHTHYSIVKSLPGSALHMQSRIIAALGTDRDRYQSAKQVQCYSGIAPVTKQSGKMKTVHHRRACPKFLKQTFHEYAGVSLKKSRWAKAYYEMQLERGKSKHMAKRALAFKWIRIIFRCWKDRVPYDEERYIARLRRSNSPLLTYMNDKVNQHSAAV